MYAAVILVGGEGNRVSSITNGKSKAELKLHKNKKILDFQIEQISKLNKKIILLSNSKFKSLNNYISKKYNNLDITIINEDKKLGTAGSLASLRKFNFKYFIIIYGDLIFNVDLKKIVQFHQKKNSECTIVVHPNNHPYDSDCIEIDDKAKSKKIFFKPHSKKIIPNLCLAGINLINKNLLKFIRINEFQDFSKDFLKLCENKVKIYAYNTREYIKDAGTPERILQIKRELTSIKYLKGNINKKIPAIFLDKDGVINKLNNKKNYQKIDDFIEGAVEAINIINKTGYLVIIITNQPAIAKGIISEKKFLKDVNKLSSKLSRNHVYFDRIYYCPHHPNKGFKNEVKRLKKNCNCRKPKNGMLLKAIKELNIDKSKSFFIGDQYTDYLASKKTNIKFIGINNKNRFKRKRIKNKKNLLSAVKYIFR